VLTGALVSLNSWLGWANKQLTDGISTHDSLDDRFDDLDPSALEARVTAAEGDIDDLETDVGALQTDVTTLESVAAGFTVESITGTTYTFVLADGNPYAKYKRTTNGSAVTITIPTNSSVAFSIGTVLHVHQGAAGQVTFSHSGVTLNTPETKKTRKQGANVMLVKVATDEWDLTGDLELA